MQKNTTKLLHLVSIRGLAAWLVVFFHSIALLRSAMPQLPYHFFYLIERGYLAVDFFFMLSGFIIFINYYEKFYLNFRHNSLIFFWNRLTRIYPVHLLMLAAYLILVPAFRYFSTSGVLPDGYTASAFWQSLLLVHAWTGGTLTWNVPSWSISAEWFVYLTFPFIAISFKACLRGIAAHVLACAAFLISIYTIYSFFGIPSLGAVSLGMPLVRAVFEFLAGSVAGSLFIRHPEFLRKSHTLVGALIVALSAIILIFDFPNYAIIPLLFFLLITFLSVEAGVISKMLSNKVLVYIGEISYSTYMVHYFIYDVFKAGWVHSGIPVSVVSLAASFLAVLLLSMLMYQFVELPAQNYLRTGILRNRTEPLQFRL